MSDKITLDMTTVDELEESFKSILTNDEKLKFESLTSNIQKIQFIIDVMKSRYLPFFDADDEMEELLDDLDVLIDVDDPNSELTEYIVDDFVKISQYIRKDDVHIDLKEQLLIILTYALDLVE
jgi:hypothetical protein